MSDITIGNLVVQMSANVARLSSDMAQAKGVVSQATDDMARAAETALHALEALGVGLTLHEFTELVRGAMEAAEHLGKLEKATGIAVESLAGLSLVAKQNGTDIDALAKAIEKLSVNMGKAPEEFAALGVSAKDPLEAFKQLADVFNQIPDIHTRNAVAMKALGKNWAEVAEVMAQGSEEIGQTIEKGIRLSHMTTELAVQSKAFNDKWIELVGTGGLMNQVTAALLPTLNRLADDLLAAKEQAGGSTTIFESLAQSFDSAVSATKEVVVWLYNHKTAVEAVAGAYASWKIAAWFAPWATELAKATVATFEKVAADMAAKASTIALAEAQVAATASSVALSAARVNELRAAVVANEGAVALEITTNGLIPAQARLTAATLAHTEAVAALGVAQREASIAANAASGAISLLGGPLGALITLLGIAATAWAVFGQKSGSAFDSANDAIARGMAIVKQFQKEAQFGSGQAGDLEAALDAVQKKIALLSQSKGPGAAKLLEEAHAQAEALQAALYKTASAHAGLTEEQKKAAAAAAEFLKTNDAEAEGIDALSTRINQYNAELIQQGNQETKLTEGQKLAIAAKQQYGEAISKNTQAAINWMLAKEKSNKLLQDEAKQNLASEKYYAEVVDAQDKSTQSVVEATERIREHNREMGVSTDELLALRQATLDTAIAEDERLLRILTTNEVESEATRAIQRHIEALKDQKKAMAETAEAQKMLDAQKEQVSLWKSIDATAQQTFVSIFQSGKSAFDRLRDTLKNGLYALLYEMTLKKWLINIVTAVSGTAVAEQAFGTSAVASASGTASGFSLLNPSSWSMTPTSDAVSKFMNTSIGNNLLGGGVDEAAYARAVLEGYQGTREGFATATTALGSATSTFAKAVDSYGGYVMAAYALTKGQYGTALGAGIGQYFGGPIGSAVGSFLGGIADSLFGGGGGPKVGGSALLQNGKFTGSQWGMQTEHQADVAFGNALVLFKSSVETLITSLGGKVDKAMSYAIGLSADPAGTAPDFTFAKLTSSSGATLYNHVNTNVARGGGQAELDVEMQRMMLAALKSADIAPWAREMVSALDPLTMTGDQLKQTFTDLNTVMAAITSAEDARRETLFSLMTDTEKLALAQSDLANAGIPTTVEGYKSMMAGLDLTTESGRKTLATMIGLKGSFDFIQQTVVDTTGAVDQLNTRLRTATDIANERRALQDQLDNLTMTDAELLTKQRDALDASNQALFDQVVAAKAAKDANEAAAQAAKDLADAAKKLADTNAQWQAQADVLQGKITQTQLDRNAQLASATDQSTRDLMNLVFGLQDLAAAAEVTANAQKTAVATASNNLSTAYKTESTALQATIDKLGAFANSLRSFRDGLLLGNLSPLTPQERYVEARSQYESLFAAAQGSDPVKAAAAQSGLQNAATAFLSASQAINASGLQYQIDFKKVSDDLKQTATWAETQADLASDSLAQLKLQVQGLIDVNTGVLSVRDAVRELVQAMAGIATPADRSTPATSLSAGVEQIYQVLLGRHSDAPGLAYWVGQAEHGMSLTQIAQAFVGSDEFKNLVNGSHASGLDYVPFDGYKAELHQGEKVLTSVEAIDYRKMGRLDMLPLVSEIKALREEVKTLRAEQKDQTGALIDSTYDANRKAANQVSASHLDAARSSAWAAKTKAVIR